MKQSELFKLLKTAGIPIAYRVFSKKQPLPHGVYYRTEPENVFADDTIFSKMQSYTLEIYNDVIDKQLEDKIELIFLENDIIFAKDEDYLPDEKLNLITYDFTIQED